MFRKLSIERKLCRGALACGLCLEACPEGVLMARPRVVTGGESVWEVTAALLHRCGLCGRCLEACPTGAVRLRKT